MKIKIKLRRSTYDDEANSSSSAAAAAAEMVASVDHLLTCILLRLPMKSLIRFKLVSKQWHSLITDPHFCGLRNPNPNRAVGLFLHVSSSPSFEYLSFSPTQSPTPQFHTLNDNSRVGIISSCNGLLLCCTFPSRNRRYYVYNPTTSRFSMLPKLSCVLRNISGISLAFDPAKSPHYKVVCVSVMGGQYQIEVYSSERGPWRKCGEPLDANAYHLNFENGVYWNGAIHWLSNEYVRGDSLCFDVENETARGIPSPPTPGEQDWRGSFYLGESCGHLHYVEMCSPRIKLDVYEMKRDYSEWFVKYKLDLTSAVASYPEMVPHGYTPGPGDWGSYVYCVLCVLLAHKEEDSFLILHIPGRLLRYNLVCGTFQTIHQFPDSEIEVLDRSLRYFVTNCSQHIESLSCV